MRLKTTAIILALTTISTSAIADEYVNGYMRHDGTYVEPYHRTNPDSNPYNNYSTQGNVNPYTGQVGNVSPQPVPVQQPPQVEWSNGLNQPRRRMGY